MATIHTLPGNLLVRSPRMDDLEAVLAVINDCDLADDGMLDHSIDELKAFWQSSNFNLETDALWFMAFDGDQLAGGILCEYERGLDLGWVGSVAVRRPWRRKGLGNALLHHAFAEYYRRGVYKVGLAVDSQNLTGATRLYERVGMHVALQRNTYEKELRAGEELSTQSVTV